MTHGLRPFFSAILLTCNFWSNLPQFFCIWLKSQFLMSCWSPFWNGSRPRIGESRSILDLTLNADSTDALLSSDANQDGKSYVLWGAINNRGFIQKNKLWQTIPKVITFDFSKNKFWCYWCTSSKHVQNELAYKCVPLAWSFVLFCSFSSKSIN